MQQRTAVLLAMSMAAGAAAAVILLSARLAENQRADRDGYQQAMAQQRREAGRALPARTSPGTPRAATEVCVRGVDGFVHSLRTALPAAATPEPFPDVLDDTGRLDVIAFATLSDMALRAERWVEQARGLPALPQRMGRVRAGEAGAAGGPDEAGEADAPGAWQPLQPARVACGGGEAYAAVPLDVEPAPARPVPGESPGVRLGE